MLAPTGRPMVPYGGVNTEEHNDWTGSIETQIMASSTTVLLRRVRQRLLAVLRRGVRRPDDVEEARYQSVHIQIWFTVALSCVAGCVLSVSVHGLTRFTVLWLLFAAMAGAGTAVVARRSALRGAVSAAIYTVVLVFSAVLLYKVPLLHHIPVFLGYPGLMAVLVGATVAEAPRRSIWMGAICLVLLLGRLVRFGHSRFLVKETASMVMVVLGLMCCGLLAAILWRRAMAELNQQARENAALTAGLRRAEQELEARVVARTDELTRRSAELRARREQLNDSLQEQERLRRDMAERAARDELTGLHNRRHFMRSLDRLADQAGSFSVLLIDIDHFKTINDIFGHPTGDEVLVTLTRELAEAVRTDDIVARVGGEEFGVLLPGTPQDEAGAIAEVMRRRVQEHRWASPLEGHTVTISIGVAGTSRGEYVVTSRLMARADRALYRAKTQGRNQVVEDRSLEIPHRIGAVR